jgi:hypothetical protein
MGVMISFEEITAFLQRDLKQQYCIEIRFSVKAMAEYDFCWMGKMPDPANQAKDCYWYGLSPDGSQAYDYDNLDVFLSAPVFDGRSLRQVWKDVKLESINGGEPEYWLPEKNGIQP